MATLFLLNATEHFRSAEQLLTATLEQRDIFVLAGLFKPKFIGEGFARDLASGDWSATKTLDLKRYVDGVVVGNSSVDYTQQPHLENAWTAHLQTTIACFDVVSQLQCGTATLATTGIGFSKEVALADAVTDIRPKLEEFSRELRLP